jgi:hypothetical protein
MDFYVALAPDLGLSSQDFIDTWNDTIECLGLAEAEHIAQPPQGFPLDPQLAQQGIVLLTGAARVVGGAYLLVVTEESS